MRCRRWAQSSFPIIRSWMIPYPSGRSAEPLGNRRWTEQVLTIASCRAAVVFLLEDHETCLLNSNESFRQGESENAFSVPLPTVFGYPQRSVCVFRGM
jgi:hypothetical protein